MRPTFAFSMCGLVAMFAACGDDGESVRDTDTADDADLGAETDADSADATDSDDSASDSADASETSDVDPDAVPTIAWGPCDGGPGNFECGILTVPVSWSTPSLGTLDVAVTRARALSARDRIGPLMFFSGGPGQSGLEYAWGSASAFVPGQGELRRRFDFVSMDVRGTGRTGPTVPCVDPAAQQQLTALIEAAPDDAAIDDLLRPVIAACLATTDVEIVRRLDSASVARDVDLFRRALGDDTLTLVGGSYGTHVAAVYASRFPAHVRGAFLASSLDPSTDLFGQLENTTRGTEAAFKAFFAWCDGEASCALRPDTGTTEDAFMALVAALDATPATDLNGPRTRTLTGHGAAHAAFLVLYGPDYAVLGAMLAGAGDGEPGPLLDVLDREAEFAGPLGVAPLFIRTLDFGLPAGATVASWNAFWRDTVVAGSPFWGPFTGPFDLEVRVSLLARLTPDEPVTSLAAPSTPPFLFVGGVADPVTPIAGARETIAALGNDSVMLETERVGHYASEGACVMERAEAYLLSPSDPVDTTRCPWPPPTPPVDETVLATATATFVRSREALRIGETPIGDLVADAMLAAAAPLDADFALMNGGGIQSSLPSDYVTTTPGLRRPPAAAPYDLVVQDVRRVLRFGNRLAVTTVTGAQLRAFLEQSLSGWTPDGTSPTSGYFVQLSGLKLVFDGTAAPGARIVSLTRLDDTPIADTSTYRVAAPDFVIYGGTGSDALAGGAPVVGDTLDVVLANHLASLGTVTPTTDGRITRTAP